MNWQKKDGCITIEDVVSRNTGMDISSFLNPPENVFVKGLPEAASAIMDAIVFDDPITIYGDYDCDGITSSAILYLTIKYLGHNKINVILPKRFTEGYGLSMKGVSRVDTGLLITVDNGIVAVDEIAAARAKGLKVVIIDHHLAREDGVLPDADVTVDPSAIPGSEFSHYCGAGLAYKLAQLLLDDKDYIAKLSALAAIGTVADVMPLVGDNRRIVIDGLAQMNGRRGNIPGLAALLMHLDMYNVSETDIGFKIGPILNAAGRMHDAGATEAFNLLVASKEEAAEMAAALTQINEERKEVVEKGMNICNALIEDNCLFGDELLVLYTTKEMEQLHEGVVGVLAGRIAEKHKRPTIVLTEVENGVLKGSGRSYGDIHLKQVLDTASDILVRYGGHAGAAGLSVEVSRVEDLRERLLESMGKIETHAEETDTLFYDIEVNAFQIPAVMAKLKRFAPFGEGNPRICFKVNKARLIPKAGKFYRLMGAEGQHIKLFGQSFDLVGFGLANAYKEAGEPLSVDAVGYVSENTFGNTTTLQLELTDFATTKAPVATSTLATSLRARLRDSGLRK